MTLVAPAGLAVPPSGIAQAIVRAAFPLRSSTPARRVT